MVSEAYIQVAPSILSADFGSLRQQVEEATAAGADMIHVDIMDGQFVPNITMGEVVVDAIRKSTNLPLNIHLMIVQPDNLIPSFIKSPTDQIIVHAEACSHLHRTVGLVKDQGNQVGVAINPATPISAVEEVLSLLDIVLVMSVNPGFGGQSFIPETVDKIRRLRKVIQDGGYSAQIEVDGGIKADWTAQDSVKAGATMLVSGTGIFNQQDTVEGAMGKMRGCLMGLGPLV
jgi:ribulose-phosphate 3-epimerase